MRLQQITCGFLQPDDGPIQALKNNRMPELMNVIEEAQGKVIIWATWTHDIIEISTALSTAYGEDSVAAYYGETPQDERQKIVDRFQDPDSPLRFFRRATPNRRIRHYFDCCAHNGLLLKQLRFRDQTAIRGPSTPHWSKRSPLLTWI